jgi:hypothetical protein
MTLKETFEALEVLFREWLATNKGRAYVAGDNNSLFACLGDAPGVFRVVFYFDQSEPRGDIDELGREDRTFLVILSRGRGFSASESDSLMLGNAGGKPLFILLEEARELVRGWDTGDETIDDTMPTYLGMARFDSGLPRTDAYQVKFSLPAQLPEYHGGDE